MVPKDAPKDAHEKSAQGSSAQEKSAQDSPTVPKLPILPEKVTEKLDTVQLLLISESNERAEKEKSDKRI